MNFEDVKKSVDFFCCSKAQYFVWWLCLLPAVPATKGVLPLGDAKVISVRDVFFLDHGICMHLCLLCKALVADLDGCRGESREPQNFAEFLHNIFFTVYTYAVAHAIASSMHHNYS